MPLNVHTSDMFLQRRRKIIMYIQRWWQQSRVEGARFSWLRTGSTHLCSYHTCTRMRVTQFAINRWGIAVIYTHVYTCSSSLFRKFQNGLLLNASSACSSNTFCHHSSYFIGGCEAPLLEYWGGDCPPCPPLPPPLI